MISRRDWLKLAGASSLAAVAPRGTLAAMKDAASHPTEVHCELKRLMLRHTWTTVMSSSTYRDTVHVQYTRDDVTGYGEGAPIIRYKEYPEQAKKAIDAVADRIADRDPWNYVKTL